MGNKWFSFLGKRLKSPQNKTITIQAVAEEKEAPVTVLSREDMAAIRIQAMFRAHLARQAFRALRSLVKLQALVRGVRVRKQSRIALHCMHALVRLQVRVRARQLLGHDNHIL